ncbi:Uncharacterised protein [Mycobacterium tuberculosis]|nr:Uncharacterised protein [Mycobacterium tuberculosis]
MLTFRPICFQSFCSISAISLAFGLYGRCTGIAHRVISVPSLTPASFSKALALVTSYGASLMVVS